MPHPGPDGSRVTQTRLSRLEMKGARTHYPPDGWDRKRKLARRIRAPGKRKPVWREICKDYVRHGRVLTDPGFVSLAVYRYGRWAIQRRSRIGRFVAGKFYGLMRIFILNVTKIWIPPGVSIGEDFHIIHGEGSLSIHPDVVIGDRCGVMHNVTIGTNMGRGAPRLGDDVFIGVNATVLGNIRIGNRVRIGANTAVSTNVPDDHVAMGSPARIYPSLPIFALKARKDPAT